MRRQQSLEISPKRLRRRSRRVRGSLRRPRRLRSQRDLKASSVRLALAVVVSAVLVSSTCQFNVCKHLFVFPFFRPVESYYNRIFSLKVLVSPFEI